MASPEAMRPPPRNLSHGQMQDQSSPKDPLPNSEAQASAKQAIILIHRSSAGSSSAYVVGKDTSSGKLFATTDKTLQKHAKQATLALVKYHGDTLSIKIKNQTHEALKISDILPLTTSLLDQTEPKPQVTGIVKQIFIHQNTLTYKIELTDTLTSTSAATTLLLPTTAVAPFYDHIPPQTLINIIPHIPSHYTHAIKLHHAEIANNDEEFLADQLPEVATSLLTSRYPNSIVLGAQGNGSLTKKHILSIKEGFTLPKLILKHKELFGKSNDVDYDNNLTIIIHARILTETFWSQLIFSFFRNRDNRDQKILLLSHIPLSVAPSNYFHQLNTHVKSLYYHQETTITLKPIRLTNSLQHPIGELRRLVVAEYRANTTDQKWTPTLLAEGGRNITANLNHSETGISYTLAVPKGCNLEAIPSPQLQQLLQSSKPIHLPVDRSGYKKMMIHIPPSQTDIANEITGHQDDYIFIPTQELTEANRSLLGVFPPSTLRTLQKKLEDKLGKPIILFPSSSTTISITHSTVSIEDTVSAVKSINHLILSAKKPLIDLIIWEGQGIWITSPPTLTRPSLDHFPKEVYQEYASFEGITPKDSPAMIQDLLRHLGGDPALLEDCRWAGSSVQPQLALLLLPREKARTLSREGIQDQNGRYYQISSEGPQLNTWLNVPAPKDILDSLKLHQQPTPPPSPLPNSPTEETVPSPPIDLTTRVYRYGKKQTAIRSLPFPPKKTLPARPRKTVEERETKESDDQEEWQVARRKDKRGRAPGTSPEKNTKQKPKTNTHYQVDKAEMDTTSEESDQDEHKHDDQ